MTTHRLIGLGAIILSLLTLTALVPVGAIGTAFAADATPQAKRSPKAFVDVTDQAGVRHRHHKP
ncbi:MAG: hypothetical protein ACYS7M_03780, partial [Planctomycetota bacterium]